MGVSRAAFEKFVLTLPAVTLHEQWESVVAKVGGKVFALVGQRGEHVVFKVTETSFAGLTTIEGIGQAAYFAKGQWVSVDKTADLKAADLKAYLREAHRIMARKLTKKARAEFGLTELK